MQLMYDAMSKWWLIFMLMVKPSAQEATSHYWRTAATECQKRESYLRPPTNNHSDTYWMQGLELMIRDKDVFTFFMIELRNDTEKNAVFCTGASGVTVNSSELSFSQASAMCGNTTLDRKVAKSLMNDIPLDESRFYWITSVDYTDFAIDEFHRCQAGVNGVGSRSQVFHTCVSDGPLPYSCQEANMSQVVRIYKRNALDIRAESLSPLIVVLPVIGVEILVISTFLLTWRFIRKRSGGTELDGKVMERQRLEYDHELYPAHAHMSLISTLSITEEYNGVVEDILEESIQEMPDSPQYKKRFESKEQTAMPSQNSIHLFKELESKCKDRLEFPRNFDIARPSQNDVTANSEQRYNYSGSLKRTIAAEINVNTQHDPSEKKPKPPLPAKPSMEKRKEMQNLLAEFRKKQLKTIIHTKIQEDLDRGSRLVTNVLEVVEVDQSEDQMHKPKSRGTYLDMTDIKRPTSDASGIESVRSSINTQRAKDPDYEDMKKLCKYRKLADKGAIRRNYERRNCHMFNSETKENKEEARCSILHRDEPILYEIDAPDAKAILQNIKRKDPKGDVIWNIKTPQRDYTYRTSRVRSESTAQNSARSNSSSNDPQIISMFFDEPPKTDSIGTCSDLYRISYITALDGILRTSTTSRSNGDDLHFAYLVDGEPLEMPSISKNVDEHIPYDPEESGEITVNSRGGGFDNISQRSTDSGCNEGNDLAVNTCDESYDNDKTIFIKITEELNPPTLHQNLPTDSQFADSDEYESDYEKPLHVQFLSPTESSQMGNRASTILVDH